MPRLSRLAVMADSSSPGTIEETVEIRAAAVTLGLKVAMLEIRARRTLQLPSKRSRGVRKR
jgi:hypothetical protein